MDDWRKELETKAMLFAAANSIQLIGQLGYGYDGTVFATSRYSAIKVLRFHRLFERERDVYLRLRKYGIANIHGFAVPQLITASEEFSLVEIGIVSPPFVLDFASAYLDERPDYPLDVMEEWTASKREQFGDERWETVRVLMFAFQQMGIYLADVKPGNIMFAD